MTTEKGGPPALIEAIDPELLEAVLALCREGVWKKDIAPALGIHRTTLDRWIATEDDGSILGDFARRWRAADAVARIESSRKSRSAHPAARNEQWFAERRWPNDFGNRQQINVSGPDGGAIPVVDLSGLSDDELAALEKVQAMLRARSAPEDE